MCKYGWSVFVTLRAPVFLLDLAQGILLRSTEISAMSQLAVLAINLIN